jgi:peptidoglycan hydrolase CwlO-like protein
MIYDGAPLGGRGSIMLRPVKPNAGRVNEESLDRQFAYEQRVIAEKASEAAVAQRERERWGHQHEFDREEMQARMQTELAAHVALRAQTAAAEAALDRDLAALPGTFNKAFDEADVAASARRESTRLMMEENARLMRERLEAARASKMREVETEAAASDEFITRFTKPAWREQAKIAQRTSGLAGMLPTDTSPF